MAGATEKETTTAIEAARQVALRFGSTRSLNQGMLLYFLYCVAKLLKEKDVLMACIALGVLTSILVLWSFHEKPHIDRRPHALPAKDDPKEGVPA